MAMVKIKSSRLLTAAAAWAGLSTTILLARALKRRANLKREAKVAREGGT